MDGVSIASSSANPFQLNAIVNAPVRQEGVSIASSSANPFQQDLPAPRCRWMRRVSIASSSANPFQRTAGSVFQGKVFCLNRFFLSESFPTRSWISSSGRAKRRLNRFFLSESFPTMTFLVLLVIVVVSQSLLPQRILSNPNSPRPCLQTTLVSIASSSANPFQH